MNFIFSSLIIAFITILIMELGDKTQLMAIVLSIKYKNRQKVFLGIATGLVLVSLIGVFAGAFVRDYLPVKELQILMSLFFIGLGAWIILDTIKMQERATDLVATCHFLEECQNKGDLCPDDLDKCKKYRTEVVAAGAFINSFSLIFLAELGDKTMLSAFALATQLDPIQTFIGTSLALQVVNGIGVAFGCQIGDKIPQKVISFVSGCLFVLTGLIILILLDNFP